jgi:hypothetical protein
MCVMLGALAGVLVLARATQRASAAPAVEPFEGACQEAREAQCDVLLWWRRDRGFADDPDDAFEREVLAGDTHAAGFVVLECDVASERVASLPSPLQPLAWWCPGLGSSSHDDGNPKTEPVRSPLGVDFFRRGTLSQFVLLDASGRPVELLSEYRAGEASEFLDDVLRVRVIREGRDAAFARARAATGAERALHLQAALRVLERWIVVRCYADELADAAANGDADVRAWAEPLLYESRVLRGCDAIGRACARELMATEPIDPRRLRMLLAEAAVEWQDVPEVLQLAACCQATADLRSARDDAARERIARELEDAIELAPASWVAKLALMMRMAIDR